MVQSRLKTIKRRDKSGLAVVLTGHLRSFISVNSDPSEIRARVINVNVQPEGETDAVVTGDVTVEVPVGVVRFRQVATIHSFVKISWRR